VSFFDPRVLVSEKLSRGDLFGYYPDLSQASKTILLAGVQHTAAQFHLGVC